MGDQFNEEPVMPGTGNGNMIPPEVLAAAQAAKDELIQLYGNAGAEYFDANNIADFSNLDVSNEQWQAYASGIFDAVTAMNMPGNLLDSSPDNLVQMSNPVSPEMMGNLMGIAAESGMSEAAINTMMDYYAAKASVGESVSIQEIMNAPLAGYGDSDPLTFLQTNNQYIADLVSQSQGVLEEAWTAEGELGIEIIEAGSVDLMGQPGSVPQVEVVDNGLKLDEDGNPVLDADGNEIHSFSVVFIPGDNYHPDGQDVDHEYDERDDFGSVYDSSLGVWLQSTADVLLAMHGNMQLVSLDINNVQAFSNSNENELIGFDFDGDGINEGVIFDGDNEPGSGGLTSGTVDLTGLNISGANVTQLLLSVFTPPAYANDGETQASDIEMMDGNFTYNFEGTLEDVEIALEGTSYEVVPFELQFEGTESVSVTNTTTQTTTQSGVNEYQNQFQAVSTLEEMNSLNSSNTTDVHVSYGERFAGNMIGQVTDPDSIYYGINKTITQFESVGGYVVDSLEYTTFETWMKTLEREISTVTDYTIDTSIEIEGNIITVNGAPVSGAIDDVDLSQEITVAGQTTTIGDWMVKSYAEWKSGETNPETYEEPQIAYTAYGWVESQTTEFGGRIKGEHHQVNTSQFLNFMTDEQLANFDFVQFNADMLYTDAARLNSILEIAEMVLETKQDMQDQFDELSNALAGLDQNDPNVQALAGVLGENATLEEFQAAVKSGALTDEQLDAVNVLLTAQDSDIDVVTVVYGPQRLNTASRDDLQDFDEFIVNLGFESIEQAVEYRHERELVNELMDVFNMPLVEGGTIENVYSALLAYQAGLSAGEAPTRDGLEAALLGSVLWRNEENVMGAGAYIAIDMILEDPSVLSSAAPINNLVPVVELDDSGMPVEGQDTTVSVLGQGIYFVPETVWQQTSHEFSGNIVYLDSNVQQFFDSLGDGYWEDWEQATALSVSNALAGLAGVDFGSREAAIEAVTAAIAAATDLPAVQAVANQLEAEGKLTVDPDHDHDITPKYLRDGAFPTMSAGAIANFADAIIGDDAIIDTSALNELSRIGNGLANPALQSELDKALADIPALVGSDVSTGTPGSPAGTIAEGHNQGGVAISS